MSSEYESGYESDTGPRDNPTCSNFDNFEPVKKVITAPIGVRRLNREGRAICRIVHAHDWKISDICLIFGGQIHRAVSRAIENAYKPPDNTLEDYDHVDAEFRKKYPPLGEESDDLTSLDSNESDSEESDMSFSPSTPPPSTTSRKQHDEDSDADYTSTTSFPSKKRPRSGTGDTAESFFHTAKKPRYETVSQSTQSRVNQTARRSSATLTRTGAKPSSSKSSSSSASSSSKEQDSPPPPPNRKSLKTPKVPSSSVSKSSPTPPPMKKSFLLPLRSASTSSEGLQSFLKDVMGLDLSKHFDLFTERGLQDVATLRTMSGWGPTQLKETLTRVLMGTQAELGGRAGLTALEVVSVELAIRDMGVAKTV